ncbi:MAG TPA: SCO family protein [Candidatus Sulfotelmatobacter sp.]|nr:SCO family protein [Candidatus Sulfotelmatobacter sp.]
MNIRIERRFFIILLIFSALLATSCQRSKPQATKRYHFTGRIISIDNQAQSASIDGDLIQGFMEPMVMSYKIKPASMLRQLSPGDSISADIAVVDHDPRDENADSDYWLENVKVTGHAAQPPANGPKAFHMPSPGEEVPSFAFTDQDGKHISLHQFRGKTVMVTFVYTRCPFPDFCPRVSSNFAEVYKQLGSNPSLAEAQLLSISFDPEHDTPKVLRNYGFSMAHTHDAVLFRRWEFAAPKAADLPKIADFFALTVKPEGGMITHSLSTAVIGPDGKIVKWYHGGDWQVSDLIKDAAEQRAMSSEQ